MKGIILCGLVLIIGIEFLEGVSKCPKDWAEYKGECLYFSYDRRNWISAQTYCRERQAYLATDDNTDKHNFIRQILSVLDGERIKNFFIGASDHVFEGQWRWLETGVPLKGYSAWAPGKPEPNITIAMNKNCLAYVWVDDDIYWSDWDCNDRNEHFICEKQAADFLNNTQIIG